MAKKQTWLAGLAGVIDLRDMIGFGGLGMVFYGLYQVHQPAAYIVVGAALFMMALARARVGDDGHS
jgi:hypothetical protein